MSDMLERLLGVEKAAAALVAEAEAEAGRLTTQARLDAQKRHAEMLKRKAEEHEAALAAERARISAERDSRNGEERERLSRLPTDRAAFNSAVLSLLHKTRE